MSIPVTWPIKKSTHEKATIDCLRNYLSSDGIDIFLTMATYDQRRIFEMIKESGRYVSAILLSR